QMTFVPRARMKSIAANIPPTLNSACASLGIASSESGQCKCQTSFLRSGLPGHPSTVTPAPRFECTQPVYGFHGVLIGHASIRIVIENGLSYGQQVRRFTKL